MMLDLFLILLSSLVKTGPLDSTTNFSVSSDIILKSLFPQSQLLKDSIIVHRKELLKETSPVLHSWRKLKVWFHKRFVMKSEKEQSTFCSKITIISQCSIIHSKKNDLLTFYCILTTVFCKLLSLNKICILNLIKII